MATPIALQRGDTFASRFDGSVETASVPKQIIPRAVLIAHAFAVLYASHSSA